MRSDENTERALLREQVARFTDAVVATRAAAIEAGSLEPVREIVDQMRELGLMEPCDPALLADAAGAIARELPSVAALLLAHHVAQSLAATNDGECLGMQLYAEPDDEPELWLSDSEPPTLTGSAELVVGGPLARAFVLAARISGADLALVEVEAAHARVSEPLHTLGMRGCPTADLMLEGAPCRVLARGEVALRRLTQVYRRHAPAVAAICAAIASRATESAFEYARQRRQGGCAIIEHDAVRELLAQMTADTLGAELSVGALLIGDTDPRKALLLARTKEQVARATRSGVQVLGGYGYLEDYVQERRMRDGRQAANLLGRAPTLSLRVITTT